MKTYLKNFLSLNYLLLVSIINFKTFPTVYVKEISLRFHRFQFLTNRSTFCIVASCKRFWRLRGLVIHLYRCCFSNRQATRENRADCSNRKASRDGDDQLITIHKKMIVGGALSCQAPDKQIRSSSASFFRYCGVFKTNDVYLIKLG